MYHTTNSKDRDWNSNSLHNLANNFNNKGFFNNSRSIFLIWSLILIVMINSTKWIKLKIGIKTSSCKINGMCNLASQCREFHSNKCNKSRFSCKIRKMIQPTLGSKSCKSSKFNNNRISYNLHFSSIHRIWRRLSKENSLLKKFQKRANRLRAKSSIQLTRYNL